MLCTDGVTEARGADGAFYPLADRLARWTHLEPDELAHTLRADLERFTGGELKDDATVLIVRRGPHAAGRQPAVEQAAKDQLSMARAAAA